MRKTSPGVWGAAWAIAGLLGLSILAGPGEAQTWGLRASGTGNDLAAVVFSSAATAVAVGVGGDITVSGDGGSSWNLGFGAAADLRAVFSAAGTVVATGDRFPPRENIAVSPDRGSSWTQLVATIPIAIRDLVDGVFVNSSVAVAVDEAVGDIYRSVDGGASWTVPRTAADVLNAVDALGGVVVAVGDNEALERSPDTGVTWPGVTTGAGTGQNMNDVVLVSSSTAVAVGNSGEAIRSTDGGDNWTNVYDAALAPNLNAVASRGLYVLAVGDAAGGSSTIVYSTDGGGSWAPAAINAVDPAQNLVDVIHLTTATVLAVGDNGTILGSADAGLTWTAQTSTTVENLVAVDFNLDNRVVVVGANGVILLSADQVSPAQPVPFKSKWLLVLLLAGYGAWTLHRRGLV